MRTKSFRISMMLVFIAGFIFSACGDGTDNPDSGQVDAADEDAGQDAGQDDEQDAGQDAGGDLATDGGDAPPLKSWMKTYGDTAEDYAFAVLALDAGGYVFAGSTDSLGVHAGVLLMKLDDDGETLWTQSYEGGTGASAKALRRYEDGFIMAGYAFVQGEGTDMMLIRTDAEGLELWRKTIGGEEDEEAQGLLADRDGNILVCGKEFVLDTICGFATGCFCVQEDGPDFVAEYQACTGDEGSIGILFEGKGYCYHACMDDVDCQAEILTEAGVSGADGCGGSQVYDAQGLQDSSCTGYDTLSFERVYSMELPAQTTATLVMTPLEEFDAALWVTTDCGDLNGALCVVGGDLSTDAPENVVFTNNEAQPKIYFVIADSYESCGLFDLTLSLSP